MENHQALQTDTSQTDKMTFEGLYDIRSFRSQDSNFILSTFLRGIYYGESFFSNTPKDIFMERYKRVAQGLITSGMIIRVACLKEDADVILGYTILSPNLDTVFFSFTKKDWRKRGIAKSLLPNNFKYIVPQHVTKLGWEILRKYEVTENPFF